MPCSFKFVHAADLHLDSPFRGLTDSSPRLREILPSATLQALDRIVTHTIGSRSDFLLLAGDLYDSKDRSLRALVEFRRQMERLAEHGISAFVVHGNHDPLNGWGVEFAMPENVVVFDGAPRTQPVLRHGREIARVTGVSYVRERVTENLARSLPSPSGGLYSIALLHANVGGQTGHADYAPASLGDLIHAGFDYWALGHVHTRSVLLDRPAVVYPGNPQGRHVRETGARGCFEVEVSEAGRTRLKFIETDVVRWARMDVSISGHSRMDALIEAIEEQARALASGFAGSTVVRCRLHGEGALHADLHRAGVAEDLAAQLRGIVDVESLQVATGPEIDIARLMESEPVVGDFLRLVDRARQDAAYREHLAESLAPLFRRRPLSEPDPGRLLEWIEKSGRLGLDLLAGQDS